VNNYHQYALTVDVVSAVLGTMMMLLLLLLLLLLLQHSLQYQILYNIVCIK
jgi:hypothetical protein